MEKKLTYLDENDICLACSYIARLTEALALTAFSRSTSGILDVEHHGIPKEQNAREWMLDNYDVVGGALGLISVMTDCINRAILDGDVLTAAYRIGQGKPKKE